MRLPIFRSERDGTLQALERLVPAIEVAVDRAQRQVGLDEIRVERQRLGERLNRGGVPSEVAAGDADPEPGRDIAVASGDDALERVDCVGPPLQSAGRPPDTIVRIGIGGLERERTAARGDRVVVAADPFEREADLDVGPGILGTDAGGLRNASSAGCPCRAECRRGRDSCRRRRRRAAAQSTA